MKPSDLPLSIIADTVVRLACIDQIQIETCIQDIEGVDWEDLGRDKEHLVENLLTLKQCIKRTKEPRDVARRWIRKIDHRTNTNPQLTLHVKHHMKLIGFEATVEQAVTTFKGTVKKLKQHSHTKYGKRIYQRYEEERKKGHRHHPRAIRIQAVNDMPIQTLIARAQAAGRRRTQTLVAPSASQTCSACFLVGHQRGECSLREEAAAYGLFKTEELRQQLQNKLINKLKEAEIGRREQSRTDLSNLAPQQLEFDVRIEPNIKGAEIATKEKEQTSIKSPESAIKTGGDYCKTKSDKKPPVNLHHKRGASETGTTSDNKPIPEDKRPRDTSRLSNTETLVVQTVTQGESSHKDLSKSTHKGGSDSSISSQRPSQHQNSHHEEYKMDKEPEKQRSPGPRRNTSSSSVNPDSEDTSEDPNGQQGSLPCQVLSFHRMLGPFIQTKVFARFRKHGQQIQMKIGDSEQTYDGSDLRVEATRGMISAAEAIKKFKVQYKGALVPTDIGFFHSCRDVTGDFDKGINEPFEEILRIVSDGTSPTVSIQQTLRSTTWIKEEDTVNRLYEIWSPSHPTFRQLNRHEDPASRRRTTQDSSPFVRWYDFVVICGDRVGSSAVTIFARQEDNKNVRLRTLQRPYDPKNCNTKEFSIKVNILEACREISTYVQQSDTPVQIGEILIVHGSEDIDMEIQIQRKSPTFSETKRIINNISPKATMWFMKFQVNLSKDFPTDPDTFWNWFQTKEKLAYLNPAQEDPSLHEASAQDADSTEGRSSKDGNQEGCGSPLLFSSFQ